MHDSSRSYCKTCDRQLKWKPWKGPIQVLSIVVLIVSLFWIKTPVIANPESTIQATPSQPFLVQPADNSTNVTIPATLELTVSDSGSDSMNVSFYGRPSVNGSDRDFLLVFIPDPQNESAIAADMFLSQTNWIVNNKANENIVFVTTTGDMVNDSRSLAQYNNADSAIDVLDKGGVWYTVAPGNHDVFYENTYYGGYFGTSRYANYSSVDGYWFAGAYDDFNSYSLFRAGEMDFILINLQFSPSQAVLDWADSLLSTYSDRRAIVAEHDILNIDNSWRNSDAYYALRDHDNLFLMLCGHMHSGDDGAAYLAGKGTGTAGQTIHIVMANYQDMNWGNGFLRLFRFSPLHDMINMSTYSPYSGDSITTYPDQMNLQYDMVSGPPFTLIGTVEGVASETNASILWDGLNYSTKYEWYAVASDGETSITSPVWSFTTKMPPVNYSPENVLLSDNTIVENSAVFTVVGTFTTLDPDAGDTFTYSLVSGIGDDDNDSFYISGNTLYASQTFDYETRSSYSIRVRSADQGGLFFEKQFVINIFDIYEIVIPTLMALSPLSIIIGSDEITLSVIGSGFRDGAQVLWNGTPRPTTFIDFSRVSISVPAMDLDDVDSVLITAKNYDSEESNPLEFNIHTFADSVPGAWYWRWVEGFYAQGITTGCAANPLRYCPDQAVTRAEMAVFLLRAKNGAATPAPAITGLFADLPVTGKEWMKPWIEEFYNEGITTGCAAGPLKYCPERQVTRAEMAVFLLRTVHGPEYVPPATTGVFSDVPVAGKEWMQPWIEQLYLEGITAGCVAEPLQYCPEQSVTRAEMATFIDRAFGYPQIP